MTRIVDALVELGLAAKNRNAADGRSTLITPTPAGKMLLIEGRERRVRTLARQIDALSPGDRATLQQAAEILKNVLPAM